MFPRYTQKAQTMTSMRVVLLTWIFPAVQAFAWHTDGHHLIALAGVQAAKDKIPSFMVAGVQTIAHAALDPDIFKQFETPQLRSREAPEHYIDLELLEQHPIPKLREDMVRFCFGNHITPTKMGMLPYALIENTQRLAIALAEHRKWPDDPHIKSKCLIYAGHLAHYTGDTAQPLHVTIHFDGRVGPDGKPPFTGIHAKTDALIGKLKLDVDTLTAGIAEKLEDKDNVYELVVQEIKASSKHVDRVYELEAQLPSGRDWQASPEIRAFGTERAQAATQFTAQMFVAAWQLSKHVRFPFWHKR